MSVHNHFLSRGAKSIFGRREALRSFVALVFSIAFFLCVATGRMNSYASAANEVVLILPHIDNALTIEDYCKTIRNELFEITVMEFKG